ncbi:hypothetical protein [Ruminococcus sp. Marseille-P6503]|uniref:hypothetical protein n=1 Tax=Ruminococcus sp. Marseille-P6503 TaxID=2364796 RepID=UPI0019D2B0B7|nr:hypothetical protein [Ruminococcus sp. Marseille-P6503]
MNTTQLNMLRIVVGIMRMGVIIAAIKNIRGSGVNNLKENSYINSYANGFLQDKERGKTVDKSAKSKTSYIKYWKEILALIIPAFAIIKTFLTGMANIILSSYNKFFNIDAKWNTIYNINFLSEILNLVAMLVLYLALNIISYKIFKNNKGVKLAFKTGLLFVISGLIILISGAALSYYDFIDFTTGMELSEWVVTIISLFLVEFMLYCYGIIFGSFARPDSILSKTSISLTDKMMNIFNLVKSRIGKIMIAGSLCIIGLIWSAFGFGSALASNRRNFTFIDNSNLVILAENDGLYLCADYSFDGDKLIIETSHQQKIPVDNVKYTIKKVRTFEISESEYPTV